MFRLMYKGYEIDEFNSREEIEDHINNVIETDSDIRREDYDIEEIDENYEDDDYEDDYEEDYEDDYEEDYEEEEEDYEKKPPLETLKCVSVNGTNNGIVIKMLGCDEIIATYDIEVNLKNFTEMELYKVFQVVSQKINYLYHEIRQIPSDKQVKDLLKDELVK